MKRILSFVLLLVIVSLLCMSSFGAKSSLHFYGDVNNNGEVDIKDATEIQRHLAKIAELSELGKDLADVNADQRVSVLDATMIQRKIAHLIDSFNHDNYGLYTFIHLNNITFSFDSGKAIATIPVTFNIDATSTDGNPLRYALIVDGVEVAESIEPVLSYTFKDKGEYLVCIVVYNKYNEEHVYEFLYKVIGKSEVSELFISAVNQNSLHLKEDTNIVITANAYGGTVPYEYSFELNEFSKKQDYSENDSFEIGKLPIGIYEANVYVKDADGNIAESVYRFEIKDLVAG